MQEVNLNKHKLSLNGDFEPSGKESHTIILQIKYPKPSQVYTLYIYAKDDNGNKVFKLIGKDGLEVVSMSDHSEPLSDMALDGSSNPIYRVGIYMYRVENKDPSTSSSIKYYYGFKNFNTDSTKNIIMNANDYLFIGGTSLYAPQNNPQYVFVLGKFNGDDHTYVYRFF